MTRIAFSSKCKYTNKNFFRIMIEDKRDLRLSFLNANRATYLSHFEQVFFVFHLKENIQCQKFCKNYISNFLKYIGTNLNIANFSVHIH